MPLFLILIIVIIKFKKIVDLKKIKKIFGLKLLNYKIFLCFAQQSHVRRISFFYYESDGQKNMAFVKRLSLRLTTYFAGTLRSILLCFGDNLTIKLEYK